MAAAITITPPSGSIQAQLDACHIRVTGADQSNEDGTQKRYRIRLTPPAGLEEETVSGYSELFNVSSDGKHEAFPGGYVFPGAGSWTVRLYDEEEEEDVTTLAVTVS